MNDADPGQRYGHTTYNIQSAVPTRGMTYVSIGAPVMVSATARLDNMLLALADSGDPNFGTSAPDVYLYTDLNGAPGAVLEQWVSVPAGTSGGLCCGVSFLISVQRPLLEVGKQYWVVVAANPAVYNSPGPAFTKISWKQNNIGDTMPLIAVGTTPGGSLPVYTPEQRFTDTLTRPAMELRGTPPGVVVVTPVPEGTAGVSALSALALVFVASHGRRRRQVNG
ncbi:hypothetical protein F183_A12830 [Bryobacterales bacterium F-183]|nr:hypothetical protein F183_A12830 [Bryobacterales bacterium F-183]